MESNTENTPATGEEQRPRGRRQVTVGKVISDRMNKTVLVTVERTVTHRLYKGQVRRSTKFAAHDETNDCRVGDVVELVATRPLSKSKRWKVRQVLQRAEGS